MDYALTELVRFFTDAKRRAEPLVLATVLRTEASTYRKAGARVLIAGEGQASGLLSGGCLESDLRLRARRVLASGRPERVWYDTRKGEDPLWGYNAGCEGALDVWLQGALPTDHYPLLSHLQHCLQTETRSMAATVVGGDATPEELGLHGHAGMAFAADSPDELRRLLAACTAERPELQRLRYDGRDLEVFVAPIELPTSLLLCGAGPDAIPINAFATALGWRVSLYDHRPEYAAREHYPQARRVLQGAAAALAEKLKPADFDAAVIMSHHLPSDIAYLQCLAASPPTFIGMLGPKARRQRLFDAVGDALAPIRDRLHGPVGLDIGAATPESIALAIVAQIHAVLAGRPGGAFH